MKFLLSILSLIFVVSECGQSQRDKNHAKSAFLKEQQSAQQAPIFQYTASTRGFFKEVKIDTSGIYTYNQRGSDEADIKPISPVSWNLLLDLLNNLNLEDLPKLEGSSTQRYSDGAAIASLKIIYPSTTYSSPQFDHGNPPEEIKQLCDAILKLSEGENLSKQSDLISEEIIGSYNLILMDGFEPADVKSGKLTIIFNDGDKVSGFGGCNSYRSSYSIEDNFVTFGMVASTKKFCKESMELENDFLRKLQQVNRFNISDNILTLLIDEKVLIKAEKQK